MRTDITPAKYLVSFQQTIGDDYQRYSNHAHRVFLNCLMLDNNRANDEKYAIAAAFHDIGIWTNKTFDYLNPSIEQASRYLIENNKQEWITEINDMIFWHHKVSPYRGTYSNTVENFRKADWIDVSAGIVNFGCSRAQLKKNRRMYQNEGFHRFLIRMAMVNWIKHPFNPLPMFKR